MKDKDNKEEEFSPFDEKEPKFLVPRTDRQLTGDT
jgi:hypothetical protein